MKQITKHFDTSGFSKAETEYIIPETNSKSMQNLPETQWLEDEISFLGYLRNFRERKHHRFFASLWPCHDWYWVLQQTAWRRMQKKRVSNTWTNSTFWSQQWCKRGKHVEHTHHHTFSVYKSNWGCVRVCTMYYVPLHLENLGFLPPDASNCLTCVVSAAKYVVVHHQGATLIANLTRKLSARESWKLFSSCIKLPSNLCSSMSKPLNLVPESCSKPLTRTLQGFAPSNSHSWSVPAHHSRSSFLESSLAWQFGNACTPCLYRINISFTCC